MENKNRIFGIPSRFLVLTAIVLSVLIHVVFGVKALSPHVQLPAEPVFSLGSFEITNTIIATLFADLLLLVIALKVRKAASSGSLVPKGFAGAVEAFLEVLYNLTESTAGKWSKQIFPFFATITLLVLVVNWMELFPGVDSVGLYEPEHVHITVADVEHSVEEGEGSEHAEESDGDAGAFGENGPCTETSFLGMKAVGGTDQRCTAAVVPFVRVASTDLNFTLALALISVVMTQVIGVKALGAGYFKKFWNTSTLFSVPVFGVIDFAVGLLEVVAEIAKVLSFSFRLFGNIFAGSVLLFVIGSLVPVFAQSAFLMLEFFVGLIQAIVFGMLTMTFMAQATISHHHDEEHH